MHLAGQDPHQQARQVLRRADRPYPVGNMPETIFKVTEYAVIGLSLDRSGQHTSQLPVHGGAGALVVPEQERQVDQAQLGHTVGQIAAGLVSHGQDPLLHQPEDIQPPIAQVENVVDVADFHLVPEPAFKPVAHALERQAEAGGGRPVAGHDDSNGSVCLAGSL